ncbi:uncharacterized protein Z518_01830 [Rhinocladiella mackenziei CBS 650.93]|uniref:Uncharacterized protein n=1 Tax=Rhinocladiella mackenziei CBS 650.93 TaxID=1442369 RepID=A0A0D2FY03_9EURO|nr:uncharacterized protein Z518_01830 [Rhinocladiella mackenziei CBS 650.93]KIX07177.1 hypothetical protein Z518_01830 [Rhinocladiella mackenziei CBS 650.93]
MAMVVIMERCGLQLIKSRLCLSIIREEIRRAAPGLLVQYPGTVVGPNAGIVIGIFVNGWMVDT